MTREDDDEEMGFGYDQFDEFDDDHGYDCDCPDCEYERHQSECGELPEHLGGGCNMSGTEHCDFDCPFRDRVFGITEDETE
jgi:hypothetical protein